VAVDVSTDIFIRRRLSQVWTYAANPDNAPAWYANIRGVGWKTQPPLAEGSRVAFVAHFLGRRLAYTYEVVELLPGRRLRMRTTVGPFPMETTYTWETAANGGTRMTLRNRGTPTGFPRLYTPFMGIAVRRANQKDLAALKYLLEGLTRRTVGADSR
jgi:hypothetical protein